MKYFVAAAAFAAMLAMSGSNAEAQAPKAKQAKPGFNAAVCACRAVARGGDTWSACMKSKGFNAPAGSGNHISC